MLKHRSENLYERVININNATTAGIPDYESLLQCNRKRA